MTPALEQRVGELERRLSRLEALLNLSSRSPQAPPAAPSPTPDPAGERFPLPEPQIKAGALLGWGGALAFLLAEAYLNRLVIDSGWLTPERQIACAALFGLALIGAGFALRRRDREYAGLLPAAGIAVLFLAIYGGHLYHHVIGLREAGAAVTVVCVASLLLCRSFESDLYAFCAVLGSYSAPFLLHNPAGTLGDLAVYYTAWGLAFCAFSLWQGSRRIYLTALYLALTGFDFAWQQTQDEWVAALAFQALQFGLFAGITAAFSVRRREPLDTGMAAAHFPPLLLFYFLQYNILDRHLHAWAPWAAVASLAAVALLYGIARRLLARPVPGGEWLTWAYAGVVLFHAGYLELTPRGFEPWAALLLVPLAAAATLRDDGVGRRWPLWVAVGAIFVINYLRVVGDMDIRSVPGWQALAAINAAMLWGAYAVCGRLTRFPGLRPVLLYAGHLCAMAGAVHLLNERVTESVVWGALAVACLLLSIRNGDAVLRQSSLAVFAATAAKAMLYDLSGASPVARIVGLTVLGAMFYLGGLLYRRLPPIDKGAG